MRHLSKLSPKGTAVGEPVLAQEDVNDEVKYELVWRDGSPFAVDDTGQIRTAVHVKKLERRIYRLTLKATDLHGNASKIRVKIYLGKG